MSTSVPFPSAGTAPAPPEGMLAVLAPPQPSPDPSTTAFEVEDGFEYSIWVSCTFPVQYTV